MLTKKLGFFSVCINIKYTNLHKINLQLLQSGKSQPTLQVQLFGPSQLPWPLHPPNMSQLNDEQSGKSHPELHVQTFGESHDP